MSPAVAGSGAAAARTAPAPVPSVVAARVGLGRPRVHLRRTDSTSDRARALAAAGAPHGTLVTAGEQTGGRGRQGRTWSAPAGEALLMSLVLRESPPLLPLAAGVAVAEVVGSRALLKWPNDVLVDGRKVAGILVEGRPQDGWSVVGIGVNVAVSLESLPAAVRASAGTLGLGPQGIEPLLAALVGRLERWLNEPAVVVLAAWRERDALRGQRVALSDGTGIGAGVDDEGRLVVALADGTTAVLLAGEVHLEGVPAEQSCRRA